MKEEYEENMNNIKTFITMILVMPLAGCILSSGDSITLGSRNNTESIILSNIMAQLIEEKTDIKVI